MDGEGNAEAIPFRPSGDALPSWGYSENDPRYEENQRRIQRWFDRGKEEGIRAWNTKFDRGFAETAGCFDTPGDGCWHDGTLIAFAVDERRSLALKAVAAQLFGDEAADPQKKLKAWLNEENKRRAKLLKDADKAEAGQLRVPNEEPKPKTRNATEEERARVIAEARAITDANGDYIRANYSHVPQEIMEPYALEDVILTQRVCQAYEQMLANKPEMWRTIEFERQAMDALFAVEKRGLPARKSNYRRLEIEVIENLEKLEQKVMDLAAEGDPIVYAKEMAGKDRWGKGKHWVEVDESGQVTTFEGGAARLDEFNPNSTPQILAALKARGADMSYMSEVDGKVSADRENLNAVDDALAAAILEFRSEFKVLSTYVRPMIGRKYESSMNMYKEPFIAPDSRIHATYRQVGARTGRMSCADPNMQNQPRDDLRLRYNIVADEGYSLVACDLTNIEMYLFAAYCGRGRLLDAVQNGDDLHLLTAKMLGFRDRARPGGIFETARQQGKTYNFSRIYGGGLRTIRRSFRCSMDEARLLKRRFDDAYPEVGNLTNLIKYRLEDEGYIQDKLISGRRFRVDPREAYKATNYLVQGTAASLLKYAVIKLHEDGVPMVALVHDEIVAHVPTEQAEDTAALIVERMTEYEGLKGIVPLKAEADIVQHWSDAKPLKEGDRAYFFDPKWAGVERRWVED